MSDTAVASIGITTDNTYGAAFVGFAVSCLYVISSVHCFPKF